MGAPLRSIWLARRTLDDLVTSMFMGGALLDHPDPDALRALLVDALGLREVAVPSLAASAGAGLCVSHAAWPFEPGSSPAASLRVPGSDRFRLSVRSLRESAERRGLPLPPAPGGLDASGLPVDDGTDDGEGPVPGFPLITVGVPSVERACDAVEALGIGAVASPPTSLASPPASLGVKASPDSGLVGALVEDVTGATVELVGGYEAPRVASVWAQPTATEATKARLLEATGLIALHPTSAPGHPAAMHLCFTGHPAETSLALVGRAAEQVLGEAVADADDTKRAQGWAWLSRFRDQLLGRAPERVGAAEAGDETGRAGVLPPRAGLALLELALHEEGEHWMEAEPSALRAVCAADGSGLPTALRAALRLGVAAGTAPGDDGEADGAPVWVLPGSDDRDVPMLCRRARRSLEPAPAGEDAGRPPILEA